MFKTMKNKICILMAIFITLFLLQGCAPDIEGPNDEEQIPDPVVETIIDMTNYTTYYFDSENGNDNNDGKSESSPKKSLESIAEIASSAGEENHVQILLKRGSTFNGNLVLEDYETTKEAPLIIDAYGNGSKYPVISGWGSDTEINAVIRVSDDNIHIYNLEITGPTAYQGIYVCPKSDGVFENLIIKGCYLHDINFIWDYDTAPKDTDPSTIDVEKVCTQYRSSGDKYGRYVYRKYAAISLDNETLLRPSWFENVIISDNKVINTGKQGIASYNRWNNQPGYNYGFNRYAGDDLSKNDPEKKIGRYPFKNIVARNNYMEACGGDGMVISGWENGLIEKNICYYANYLGRTGYWNAGIWVFGSRDIVMQYNEAAYTFLGGGDGQGFDIDYACSNITFQYNYSHHNEGGGLLLCNNITTLSRYDEQGNKVETVTSKGKWENNHIRNNLFVNNGTKSKPERSAFLTIARQTDDFYAYNNTIILRDDINGQSIINTEDKNATALCYRAHFYNNIFYSKTNKNAGFTISMMRDFEFNNNLYYNIGTTGLTTVKDANAITEIDPGFGTVSDFDGWNKVSQFIPNNEQIFSLGKAFDNIEPASYDILKKSTSKINYLGAYSQK